MDRKIAALLAKPVWHAERKALRDILLGCGLTETVKWGNLCYTDSGANIVMIYALKAYCGLSFFKGALMNDPEKVLYQRSEQMQAARLMRFTGLPAISQARGQISAFVADTGAQARVCVAYRGCKAISDAPRADRQECGADICRQRDI